MADNGNAAPRPLLHRWVRGHPVGFRRKLCIARIERRAGQVWGHTPEQRVAASYPSDRPPSGHRPGRCQARHVRILQIGGSEVLPGGWKKYLVMTARCIRTENISLREIGTWEKVRYNCGYVVNGVRSNAIPVYVWQAGPFSQVPISRNGKFSVRIQRTIVTTFFRPPLGVRYNAIQLYPL